MQFILHSHFFVVYLHKKDMNDYNIYNFTNRKVYITGDVHGNFVKLIFSLTQKLIKDAVVIVAGDVGIGFEQSEYYHQVYNTTMKKFLEKHNIDLICLRGNHDDPEYFNNPQMVINEPRWKTIPDYSIIRIFNEQQMVKDIPETLISTHDILCVGGATSIDRVDRLRVEHKNYLEHQRYGARIKKCYWENEHPIYDEEILNKIKSDEINIDTVVTHSCPSFCYPIHKDGIKYWMLIDAKLEEDLNIERELIDNLYYHLREDKHPITNWIYGHYHTSQKEIHDGINFTLLNCVDFNFEIMEI